MSMGRSKARRKRVPNRPRVSIEQASGSSSTFGLPGEQIKMSRRGIYNCLLACIAQGIEEYLLLTGALKLEDFHQDDRVKFKGLPVYGGQAGGTIQACIRELEEFFAEGGLCDNYLAELRNIGFRDIPSSRIIRERLRSGHPFSELGYNRHE